MRNIQKVIATGISVAMFTTMCVIAPAAASAEEATTTADTPYLTILTGANNDQVIATLTEDEVKSLAAKSTTDGAWMAKTKTGGKIFYSPKGSYVTYEALADYVGIDSYTTVCAGAPDGLPVPDGVVSKDQAENGKFFPAWDGSNAVTEGAVKAPGAILLSYSVGFTGDENTFAAGALDAAKAEYAAGNITTLPNAAAGTLESDFKAGTVASGKCFFSGIDKVAFGDAVVSYSWSAKAAKTSVKYSATKKQTVKITAKGAQGKVTYSVKSTPKAGKKAVKVSSKGVVTFAKKAAKGTYKINVKCAGNGSFYKASTKTVSIKVK